MLTCYDAAALLHIGSNPQADSISETNYLSFLRVAASVLAVQHCNMEVQKADAAHQPQVGKHMAKHDSPSSASAYGCWL